MIKRAFTMVEILIVIAIIGLLSVSLIPNLSGAPAKAWACKAGYSWHGSSWRCDRARRSHAPAAQGTRERRRARGPHQEDRGWTGGRGNAKRDGGALSKLVHHRSEEARSRTRGHPGQ